MKKSVWGTVLLRCQFFQNLPIDVLMESIEIIESMNID
jgi:hypothetical protein